MFQGGQRVYGSMVHDARSYAKSRCNSCSKKNFNELYYDRVSSQYVSGNFILDSHFDRAIRAKIISPVIDGYYTESVQNISLKKASELKSRGYTISRVPDSTDLFPPIKIPSNIKNIYSVGKRSPRVNFSTLQWNAIKKKNIPSIVSKSSFNPRRIFAESYKYRVRWKNGEPRILVLDQHAVDYYRGVGVTVTRIGTNSYSSSQSEKINRDNLQRQKIQSLETELKNQKAWIESINKRTSSQLVNLGNSTVDRSGEIDHNRKRLDEFEKWLNEMNTKISQQLVDLGKATSDVSKAVEIKKSEELVRNVAEGSKQFGGSVTEGITSFFTNPSNIILLMIILLGGIMVIKR